VGHRRCDFAKYDSFEQSITDHARFFPSHRRYARALQFKNNPEAFARENAQAGYATGPTMRTSHCADASAYLYRFDHENAVSPVHGEPHSMIIDTTAIG